MEDSRVFGLNQSSKIFCLKNGSKLYARKDFRLVITNFQLFLKKFLIFSFDWAIFRLMWRCEMPLWKHKNVQGINWEGYFRVLGASGKSKVEIEYPKY